MSAIKTAIMIACFMGIISAVINMMSPENGMKKHLMSLLGLIALLAVLSPFGEEGFKLSLRDIDLDYDITQNADNARTEMAQIFLAEAKASYDEYFIGVLNKNDIRAAGVDTALTVSDDWELEIDHIDVELYDIAQAETAMELIQKETPNIEVLIWQVENEGIDIGAAE